MWVAKDGKIFGRFWKP